MGTYRTRVTWCMGSIYVLIQTNYKTNMYKAVRQIGAQLGPSSKLWNDC